MIVFLKPDVIPGDVKKELAGLGFFGHEIGALEKIGERQCYVVAKPVDKAIELIRAIPGVDRIEVAPDEPRGTFCSRLDG